MPVPACTLLVDMRLKAVKNLSEIVILYNNVQRTWESKALARDAAVSKTS